MTAVPRALRAAAAAGGGAAPRVLGHVAGVARRRVQGTHEVDPWGLDPDLLSVVSPLAGLRWSVEAEGAEHLPAEGPAVLVHNRAVGVSEPVVVARGVRRATGRTVRTAALVDVAPLATLGRALGAVVDHPEELRALLRAGEVVTVPLGRALRPGTGVGRLRAEALAPALDTAAPVVPVAVLGHELGRRWRVRVGRPLAPPAGPGPLAVADLVDAARAGVADLLAAAPAR